MPAPVRENRRAVTPAGIRGKVMEQSGYRCQFHGADGRRCGQRSNLHIDHTIPLAKGSAHGISNLRVLCAAHNLHEARKDFPGVARSIMGKRKAGTG